MRMNSSLPWLAACLGLAAPSEAAATPTPATPPPSAATAGRPSVQKQFDAASAALDQAHWQAALDIFDSIEGRLTSRNVRSLAIVRVRKASALAALGRAAEAESALRLGLPALPADDPSLNDDRYLGLVALGGIAEAALDYGEALKDYRAAEPLLTDFRAKGGAIRGLIQTEMFYDAPAALAQADAAVATAAAVSPRNKPLEGAFRILRGRVLLNMGRHREAEQELEQAVELLGGLTQRVDSNDLSARSDLAIAALLSGDEEKAHKYMAWTGAGQFADSFPMGEGMVPPPCGSDLSPADVAVVQFSIRDDGSVGYATPIYSSRQGPSALAFAEAVTGWSWKPDELTRIKPLFRALTRVELRCSTGAQHSSVDDMLRPDLDRWLDSRGFPADERDGRSDAARLKPLQAELARREAASGPTAIALLPVLTDLSSNALIPSDDARSELATGLAIARAEKAPPPVLAWFGIRLAQLGWRRRQVQDHRADALRALLADPAIGPDPKAATAVRLALAEILHVSNRRPAEAIAILSQVPSTPGLEPHDPLRAAALVRLASLQLVAGNAEAARAAYAASGLGSDQCALLDSAPKVKFNGASDSNFPQEAIKWGFEGWAKVQFDLLPTGATTNVRTVVAYPPFVFEKSAKTVLDSARYEQTFRPDGGLGCGGLTTGVTYVMPR